MATSLRTGWNKREFLETNLTGNRGALHELLKQGIWQGGGNTAPINTESLALLTAAQVIESENS